MQVIINIDEEVYEKALANKNTDTMLDFDDEVILKAALEKGIPLLNIINMLDEMDLADYDYHTIQAIEQILNGDEVTH